MVDHNTAATTAGPAPAEPEPAAPEDELDVDAPESPEGTEPETLRFDIAIV